MENRALALIEVKALDEKRRIFRGWATTAETDRMDDVIDPRGATFRNPVSLLHQHNHSLPIGVARLKKATKEGIEFEAEIPIVTEPGPLKDRVDTAWGEIKAGLVRAVSIGFRPLKDGYEAIAGTGGLLFKAIEILEISTVSVPANPGAQITEIKSIDRRLRAASGNAHSAVRKNPPGVSGSDHPIMGDKKMSDIETQGAELDTRRAEIVADMKSFGDVTDLDDEQSAEYDALAEELRGVDKKLARVNSLKAALGTARQIDGSTQKSGSDARARITVPAAAKNELPKGTLFARYALAIMAGKGSMSDTLEYAKRWNGQTPEVSQFIKAVAGTSVEASPGWGSELVYQSNVASEFIELLRPATIMGRITGFRMVPFNVRVGGQTAGATVNWVGEAASKPVGENEYSETTLGYNKIAGIVPFSEELLRLSSPNVEALVRDDLVKGISKFMDEQFLNSTITATSTRPASVTNGVSGAAASGTDADAFWYDWNVALAAYDTANSELNTLHIAMTPALARGLSSLRNAFGQKELPSLNARGGSIDDFPVLVSNSVPSGNIVFINAEDILVADDGTVRLDSSNQATLDLDGGDTPDVNLWQKNLIAVRAERWLTYKKARSTAVQRIHTATYGPTESSP